MSRELDNLENIYKKISENRGYADNENISMFSVTDSWLDTVEPEIACLESMIEDNFHSKALQSVGVTILGSLDAELSGIAGRLSMLAARVHRLHVPFKHEDPSK